VILFATGGSGGHIYPALAVAEELKQQGLEVAFIGQAAGMEARLVPEGGFGFYGVRAGKWDRSRPDPRQALRALLGLKDAYGIVRSLKPQLAVGFGGFASFPGLLAAVRRGIPIVLHEQNAFPGRVTRWLHGYAAAVATAQPEVGARLKRARRLVQVGLPVREKLFDKREARGVLGLPLDGKLVLVMGGSQGSLRLNRTVPASYRELGNVELTILHSSGPRWETEVREEVADLKSYHVAGYLDATLAWSAADLAITRAGAGTVAEAAFHGVPLLMVPLPSAAEDHQTHNARAVEAAGAGKLVAEAPLEELAARLADEWRTFLDDGVLAASSRAALARSPQGAAKRMAALVSEMLESNATAKALLEYPS
jgi:UDP-N-acetylglucosamine--N-acetylmuramyl-(pentapeptide) pyrophosphoryl-undecaprenol N-acetylglucosamine transferase